MNPESSTSARNKGRSLEPPDALVLVENDRTIDGRYDDFDDFTGERYHFIQKYARQIRPGTSFVYYRGIRHAGGRRPVAEYFGVGRIGQVWPDPRPATPGPRLYCAIEDYQPFPHVVPARQNGEWLEPIRSSFGFQRSVRRISKELFEHISALGGLIGGVPAEESAVLGSTAATGNSPGGVVVDFRECEALWLPGPKVSSLDGTGSLGIRRSAAAHRTGQQGEALAMEYLRSVLSSAEAQTLRSVAHLCMGWDLEYEDEAGLVAVEVKATGSPGFVSVELTRGEWQAAEERGNRYRLLLISDVWSGAPGIQMVPDPAGAVRDRGFRLSPLVFQFAPPPHTNRS